MIPPEKIDGASILYYACSGLCPFGYIKYENGEVATEIYGFAIGKFKNNDAIYRFSCNRNWEVEQDAQYDSIESAMNNIPDQYQKCAVVWNKSK